ncbi:addiction module RelE/StbE family toxin [Duganella sp. 1411]|jgi:addiction module RelE/StbE family toxin|uniref:type II toxin-antitoxin system RelE/ParE family toxin n=1 Tax=Duganella sp. 1411 TaxID=2806572 RepID=UPI001AE46663|nr:type II toxin-antitoxin system RelE/ParE family toxin [Duganella sp. 1411]MBP1205434.1 addiction module RelE/StbE family toxin [Duganella sp. 1411]
MAPDLQPHWSRRALSDLSNIVDFVSIDKPLAARKLAQAIRAKTEALRTSPHLGRETTPGIRELIVHRHYLITYRIKSDRIEILQIWHTARKR